MSHRAALLPCRYDLFALLALTLTKTWSQDGMMAGRHLKTHNDISMEGWLTL